MEQYKIKKIFSSKAGGKEEIIIDNVTEEIPFTIYVNDHEIVTLLASPVDLIELAIGFIFSSGIIKKNEEIKEINLDEKKWTIHLTLINDNFDTSILTKRLYTSGCGKGTMFYNVVDIMYKNKERKSANIDKEHIFKLMQEFQTSSEEFNKTGGVHSSGLADNNKMLVIKEDIGRHNAIDKIFGYCLKNNIELKDKMILTSGRISSEILLKIQKTDISLIVSRSAPTNQAIKHAESAGIMLIGFARGQRMNVYTFKERVI